MAWSPGPTAPWVQAANRGDRPEYIPMPGPFDPDELVVAARDRHTGDGEIDPGILEPLALVCDGLERTARLTPLGRWATQRHLRRLLDVHLDLDAYRRRDPGLRDERIAAPIFVVGAPRSGTTATHRLLAADPAHRAPEGWEFLAPVPPPEPESYDSDPRIAAMADELGFPQAVSEGLRSIHLYSARMPKECLSAMSFAFRSEEFVSRYELPAYVDWLRACDMGPAYETHHRVLQVLQRRMPPRRWVLKSPVHLQALPDVVVAYPDARFVVTHREPAEVIASVSSLVATVRSAFSEAVDPVAIGRYHLDLYARSLERLVGHVDSGLLAPARTVHLRHRDLVRDPMHALSQLYDGLGLELGSATRQEAARVVGAAREDAVGAHRYEPADFGLATADLVAPFAAYRDRFLSRG